MIRNIMIRVVPVCQSHKKQREKEEKKGQRVGEKKQRGEKLEIRERQERREERRGERRGDRELCLSPHREFVLHTTADFVGKEEQVESIKR
jgi:hypothetical protein